MDEIIYMPIYFGGDYFQMISVGDKVKIPYISDNNKHNNEIGTITWLNEYNYYPNGDYSVVEKRTQGIITYDDGATLNVANIYREGSGVVSPILKIS